MRHTAIFAGTLAALLALAAPARAGMVEDCGRDRDPDLQIGNCTAVIRSGQYSSGILASAYNNRGNAYRNLGDYRRAIEDYDQALRLDPGFALASDNRALAMDRLNRSEGACRRTGSSSPPQILPGELQAAKELERAWSERTRRGVQNGLLWTGDYIARLDGDFGNLTRKAIRSFQARNGCSPSGYLTPPQIESLELQRLAAVDNVGFHIIDEMKTGIRIGIPEKIFQRSTEAGRFLRFESSPGFPPARLSLVSLRGGMDELIAMYYETLSDLKEGDAAYHVCRDGWFVVSYKDGGHRVYSHVISDGEEVKGFMMFWPTSDSMLFEPISIAMFNSFKPLVGIVLESQTPGTND